MSTTKRTRPFAVFTVAALLLAACGDETAATAATTEAEAPAETTAAPERDHRTRGYGGSRGDIGCGATERRAGQDRHPHVDHLELRAVGTAGPRRRPAGRGRDQRRRWCGGRPLELVIEDDQNSPEEAVPAYERLVEEGVVAVGGIISSSVGGATAPLAESNQIPTFLVKSGDQTILTPDSRFTFRTCLPAAPTVAGPIIEYAQENGLTKIGAIVADYPWGHAFQSSIETAVAAADGIELQLEVAPVPEQDFTTYLRAIDEFGPDLLVATGHPPGGGPIIAQSNDLGMDVPVIGAYSPWALVMGGAGDVALGRYADFDCADYQSNGVPGTGPPLPGDVVDNTFMDDDAVAGVRHRDDDRRGHRRGRRRSGGDRRVVAHARVRPARSTRSR